VFDLISKTEIETGDLDIHSTKHFFLKNLFFESDFFIELTW
tara:strand:+ start:269 stop:391 length:123 start_codon:yes stop_codon:yes gene_type:complete